MNTLRVLLADAPAPDRAEAWALFDGTGALQKVGRDRPEAWPPADHREAVIASSRARIAAVTLPPVPPARLQAAATFAVEDQLAAPIDDQQVLATAQDATGHVRIFVVDRALLRSIAGAAWGFSRVVAEVDLIPADTRWHWCIDHARPAQTFVRAPDGGAFPTGGLTDELELPRELVLLLDRSSPGPTAVCVHGGVTAAQLERWSALAGASFTAAAPWRWHDAPADAFAAATDLLQRQSARDASRSARPPWYVLRPAAIVAAAALALHVAMTAGEWVSLKLDARRDQQLWNSIGASAGIATAAGSDVAALRTALLHRYAELRHANGTAAPDDALPLLARAAPTLARLPAGAFKSATFAGGTWTIELGVLDAAALRQFDAGMKSAGLATLLATTAAGTRARFGSR